MGRFATTVDLYEQFRPPYPAAFFREVAQRLALTKRHALIDLGTGPGLLALGFADYVGRIVAVDPEPKMLAVARQAAGQAGREVTLVDSRAEDVPEDIGRFDLVTIGRALHWSDKELWSQSRSGGRGRRELSSLLQGTTFQAAEVIKVESVKETSVADLTQRMLTFSSSSPAALGEKVESMLRDVEARLLPMSRDGVFTEFVVSTAQIARRR